MKKNILRIIQLTVGSDLILPIFLLVAYGLFLWIIKGILPTSDELLQFFAHYYAKYGYEILFVAALLESLVVINLFAPGQVALALGIIFARTGQTHLPLVMLSVFCGVMVGFTLDYLIGFYGFGDILERFGQKLFLTKAKQQLKKSGSIGLFISFINANIGSYMSLAAGATRYNPKSFFVVTIFSSLFWIASWSLLIYSLGDLVLFIIHKYSLLFSVLFIGLLIFSLAWNSNKTEKINN